jgi:hypothetical protein
MRTTIFAYVIAIFGLALIVAGAWDISVLSNEQTFVVTLSDYRVSIRTIAGGLIMLGLAQALRLLLEINAMRQEPFTVNAMRQEPFTAGVRQLYKELLGREADASGLKHWSEVAARSGSLGAVRVGIMASEEYRSKKK